MSSPTTSNASQRRRLPVWLWVVGALCLVALAAFALTFLLIRDKGYTLEMVVTPPDSEVFVDEVRRGVPTADGKIRVENLRGGTRMIRVSREGYRDYNGTVLLEEREVEAVVARLVPTAPPTPAATPAALRREIDYGGPMVLVSAGDFIMGSNDYENDEGPAQTVSVAAFYIDKYEVTNKEYLSYCEATKHPHPLDTDRDPGYFRKRQLAPVIGVDWEDAKAFCSASYAGRPPKRLPSEAEWEKAASWDESAPPEKRKRLWPWGDAAEPGRAVLARGDCCPGEVGQHPNGVSPYGVHDMAGNVNEWVDAFYQPYKGNQTANPNFGEKYRVARGCSFPCSLNDARTTRRFFWLPRFSPKDIEESNWVNGIRCAVSADDPQLQEHLRGR
ncbi:MAG TPA: SUMF1/EgtB/PvdO family nonheme iron enzyme [Pyrinomonadaceae bacterium]|jgi:formylglycine-generating enzyme required for sulfatase activity